MPEYIERGTAKELAKKIDNGVPWSMRSVLLLLDSVHAADVGPVRHAAWVGNPPKSTCSACGKYAKWDSEAGGWWSEVRTPYCPNCGSKMDLEDKQ